MRLLYLFRYSGGRMKIVAILQARLGSTRLKNKMMLPLGGKPLVQNVIERVPRATRIDAMVLAVPSADAATLAPIANGRAWLYAYPGDESDLVGRYLGAAQAYDADVVVRIPCDNPCVDPAYIDQAVQVYLESPHLYVSTMFPHVRDRIYLDGVGAEVLSMSRLKWLDQATTGHASYREHPHLLFQDHHLIDGWEQYQTYANVSETIRLDVNDQKDYEFVSDIFSHFGHNRFTTAEVVVYLASKKVPA